jgi:hypothetical protein
LSKYGTSRYRVLPNEFLKDVCKYAFLYKDAMRNGYHMIEVLDEDIILVKYSKVKLWITHLISKKRKSKYEYRLYAAQ